MFFSHLKVSIKINTLLRPLPMAIRVTFPPTPFSELCYHLLLNPKQMTLCCLGRCYKQNQLHRLIINRLSAIMSLGQLGLRWISPNPLPPSPAAHAGLRASHLRSGHESQVTTAVRVGSLRLYRGGECVNSLFGFCQTELEG